MFVRRIVCAGVILAAPLWCACATEKSPLPNVVLILADDLGYGDLGFQGCTDIPTPRLDALASSGVRFTAGYVSGAHCSPSRAGLITGRYQQRFGHEFNPTSTVPALDEFGLSLDETTLPQRLKPAGYATGLIGKWHLGFAPRFHPLERGFDEFFGFLGGAHPYAEGAPNNYPNAEVNPLYRDRGRIEEPDYLTDAFAREAVDFVERHKAEPFFLLLSFNAVHNPLQAKPEHLQKFASIADERRRSYAGLVASMDEAVGEVLDKLQAEKLTERTLVIFLSDNGGPTDTGSTNTPLKGTKTTTWEGALRVPFVLSWPGNLPAGTTYDEPVIHLDLTPTILAAAGAVIDDPEKLDGVNLLPYLAGETSGTPHQSLYWRFGRQIAIRQGNWKLVMVRGDQQPRLYNLADDIGETSDLAEANPERVRRLQADWDAWNATLVDPKWVPKPHEAYRSGNGD